MHIYARLRVSALAKRSCGYEFISIGWENVENVGQPLSERLRRFGPLVHVSTRKLARKSHPHN